MFIPRFPLAGRVCPLAAGNFDPQIPPDFDEAAKGAGPRGHGDGGKRWAFWGDHPNPFFLERISASAFFVLFFFFYFTSQPFFLLRISASSCFFTWVWGFFRGGALLCFRLQPNFGF